MSTPLENKSTIEEIRERFDRDVERFSNLATGQEAAVDAPVILELVAKACARHLRPGCAVLDVGCGGGNFTLRVLQETGGLHCHLADLSGPMLERAQERVRAQGRAASVTASQNDLRTLPFAPASFDAILAGAVLHHLRGDSDWAAAFRRFHAWLKPGGRMYVADLVCFDIPEVQALMWERFGTHLEAVGGDAHREKVFACIDKEDSPRSLPFQFGQLQSAGFSAFDVLHRNGVCACYVAVK